MVPVFGRCLMPLGTNFTLGSDGKDELENGVSANIIIL